MQGVILTNIRDVITAGQKLLTQCGEGDIFTFQRFLPAGINKHIKFTVLIIVDDNRLSLFIFALIICPQRHYLNQPGIVQSQHPSDRLRRNGGIVIDEHPRQPVFEACTVSLIEMRHDIFDNLMQPQQGIAPRHGVLLLFITFNFQQIEPRPVKWIVMDAVSKTGLGERIGSERFKLYLLAPLRCRLL